MAKYKVVVTDMRFPAYREEEAALAGLDAELILTNCATPAEVLAACADADAMLVNLAPVPAQTIAGLRRCKVISRYGVGYDNVDVPAATRRGVWVANVPDYCMEDVSDHAMALLLSVAKRVTQRDKQIRSGRWNLNVQFPTRRLQGKTVGFVGFGRIAGAMLRKLAGFQLGEVLVCDPYIDESAARLAGAKKVDLDTLLKESDFVSIHAPLTDQTRGLLDATALAKMKPTAIVINTSRGGLVRQADLVEALKSGRIAGAGLDVFEVEPLPADSELRSLDTVVLRLATARGASPEQMFGRHANLE